MLRKIGRYEVKAEVGRGGMSTVYRAYDPEFGRDVAIKILPHEFLHDPQFRIRFEREARTIAALEHYAIVPLYDMGELDGQPYTVGRFMAGGTLGEMIKRAPLSVMDAGKTLVRVASALDAAHVRGIIHRDLKPSNILLDQYGSVFLSDFGIARLVRSTSTTLTGSAIIGSPPYMSPEQIQGDVDLDGRSDVYALGVILFEMLTGRLPYLADSPTQAIMAHLLEPVPKLTDLRPELPKACEEVIQKAMAKNRDDRYATAGEMAIALQAAVFGESNGVPLYLPDDTIRMAKPIKSAQGGILKSRGVLALASLLVIFVALVSMWGLPRLVNSPIDQGALSPIPVASVTSNELRIATPGSKTAGILRPTPLSSNPSDQATRSALVNVPALPAQLFGGVDKIAFLKNNNVWMMDPDGQNIKQLTIDGSPRSNLAWGENKNTLLYIVGRCIISLDIERNNEQSEICFGPEDQLQFFDISYKNRKAIFGINQKLYLVSYDPEKFKNVHFRSDLQDLAFCKSLAPYNFDVVNAKAAYLSNDGNKFAAIVTGNSVPDTNKIDTIQVFDISTCQKILPVLDAFPTTLSEKNQVLDRRFSILGYDEIPQIDDFGWDGVSTFAFVGYNKNGYGPLYMYHMDSGEIESAVNPIEGACCYRDVRWSVDGKFIAFTFEDNRQGTEALPHYYFIPYATLGTGVKYQSIQLPDQFLNDFAGQMQLALRPAAITP